VTYKLICFEKGHSLRHEFTAPTLEEILSASVCAFNQAYELSEIQRDDKLFLTSDKIYKLIGKAIY
jgi:hypothetical protein